MTAAEDAAFAAWLNEHRTQRGVIPSDPYIPVPGYYDNRDRWHELARINGRPVEAVLVPNPDDAEVDGFHDRFRQP